MTTLADFTTPDEVRAVLGVTPEELEDITLSMPLYLRQLQFDLSDISDTIEADYLTVAALSSRTTVQQRFYDVMQAYAPYSVAKELLTSLAVFSPRVITDGRATAERVTDPFQDVKDGVDAGLVVLRQRLRAVALTLGNTTKAATSTFSYSVSAGLATDPVTGQ